MLVAAATFSWGHRVTAWLRVRRLRAAATQVGYGAPVIEAGGGAASGGATPHQTDVPASGGSGRLPAWALIVQFVISTYGGYFGGGMGIMMLAALSIAGMQDMHEMNGLKTMLAITINGIALAAFIVSGAISWGPGIVMAVGGIAGGYAGAAAARRVSGASVRTTVIVIAWGMTAYFFLR
jgi:uncharacterized membrane protein YfcA